MPDSPPPQTLHLKVQLRDVHPAVWRRVRVVDCLSIADLHRAIQVLMGWNDEHLHRFHIHGRSYGISAVGGPSFGEDAATVPLARFRFRPTERFLYEYDFRAGWRIDIRIEKVLATAPRQAYPVCLAGRETGPPDGCGGPHDFAGHRRAATGWAMAEDLDAVAAVLRRVADGDRSALERAVARLDARRPFLPGGFERAAVNAALRQAFTAERGSG
jgi:hypothetical protein